MNAKLGEIVKANRLNRKLSLRGFALLCGINHSYLSGIEKGLDYSLTIETLQKLATGMKIGLYDLMNQAGYFNNSEERSVKKCL